MAQQTPTENKKEEVEPMVILITKVILTSVTIASVICGIMVIYYYIKKR